MAMTRQLWSINGLAVELQKDRRTVANALRSTPADGTTSGAKAWFLTTALMALGGGVKSAEGLDPAQERAAKDRAQREVSEFNLAVARGEMVRIEDVGAQVERDYAVVKTRILAIPGKLGADLTPQMVERVEAEIRDALEELHDGRDNGCPSGPPPTGEESP